MNRIFSLAYRHGLAVAAAAVCGFAVPAAIRPRFGRVRSRRPLRRLRLLLAVRVTAARPVRKTLRLESVQPGQIEAFEQTPLFAKLPAYVEKLHVDIGDRVEADNSSWTCCSPS